MKRKLITLADRLIDAREEKKWTKAELKRTAGINSSSTLTELENGSITESPQLPKIAAALGVEVLWLQHGKGPRTRSSSKDAEQYAGLSQIALQIARNANELSEEAQLVVLHMVSFVKMKNKGQDLVKLMQIAEDSQPENSPQ